MFKRLVLRRLNDLRVGLTLGLRRLFAGHQKVLHRADQLWNAEEFTGGPAWKVYALLQEVADGIKDLQEREKHMTKVVDDLVGQVKSLRGVVDSADALLAKLFALIQGAIDTGDVTKVQAALDDLKAQQTDLANAVAANTPPAPATP